MKRCLSMVLALFLLLSCILVGTQTVSASEKSSDSRAIAIVFDNSGSMYCDGIQAWCRATYAMEVFASMLNNGDNLLIYPMHPITVGGNEYTMDNPLKVTDASQASIIRDIYTPTALGTPIESVDCAIKGLQTVKADKKYMIVLTDGDAFYQNGSKMSANETQHQLDVRFQEHAGKSMSIMYLGIGSEVVMPETAKSEYFEKKQAKNSEDVLSALTEMCNKIFGRDTLPKNHISGKNVEFDISMNKLIVFVQGENVADLKVTGASGPVGKQVGTASTKYGTAGCGTYESVPDTSLQGMMVTYTDCDAGSYTIDYTGNATNIEIYYEPDADLDFVFTDVMGNTVDAKALYGGDYKVSFGMKDAKTGKLISSDLLGNPHYQGSYSINGKEVPITCDAQNGEVPVTLNMDETFDANLTVTYLSGYTITKDSSDFGWPEGGIKVSARPAGDLVLEITGGDDSYTLQDLEKGAPYIAKVYYQGEQLTGTDLESVELKWEPDFSNAEIMKELVDDHYELSLHYKDSDAPEKTECGDCTVFIYAFYSAKNSSEAQTQSPLSYNIIDDFPTLQMDMYAPEDYIVISELESSEAIVVKLTNNGVALTPEEFAGTELKVDCGGIDYTVTAREEDSSYLIRLLPTEGIEKGDYPINVKAVYTDHIGRTTQTDDSLTITLSNLPLWVKWLINLLLLIALIIIILIILHIKVLPKHAHVNKKDSTMIFDGEDETKSTTFQSKIEKGQMTLYSKYAGTKTGLAMEVKPGKESYLKKSQQRRSAEVKSASVRKYGTATIDEATIGSVKYVLNDETGKLERMPKDDKPFTLKHGMTVSYSGTMLNAGVPKPFTVNTKLNFKKK